MKMNDKPLQRLTLAVGYWLLASALLLWSWNTLVDLFGMPGAEFRHALAAIALVLLLRLLLNRPHRSGHGSGHGNR
jgi:hypothetical protein